MGQVLVEYDAERDLMIHTIIGSVTFEQMREQISVLYRAEHVALNVMWDFTQGSLEAIGTPDLLSIVPLVKSFGGVRAGGKSAIIVSGDLEFGLARMLEALAEGNQLEHTISVFRTREEADIWLAG